MIQSIRGVTVGVTHSCDLGKFRELSRLKCTCYNTVRRLRFIAVQRMHLYTGGLRNKVITNKGLIIHENEWE